MLVACQTWVWLEHGQRPCYTRRPGHTQRRFCSLFETWEIPGAGSHIELSPLPAVGVTLCRGGILRSQGASGSAHAVAGDAAGGASSSLHGQ